MEWRDYIVEVCITIGAVITAYLIWQIIKRRLIASPNPKVKRFDQPLPPSPYRIFKVVQGIRAGYIICEAKADKEDEEETVILFNRKQAFFKAGKEITLSKKKVARQIGEYQFYGTPHQARYVPIYEIMHP